MNMSNDIGAINTLICAQTPGMALQRPFYTDDEIFRRDLECIVSKQWLLVAHESEISGRGDYLTYEVAGESIVVVRGRDDVVRAFFNVCRHRGSRICLEPKGNRRTLTCPYHAWVWDLQGNLIGARSMPEGFDPSSWPLHSCRVRVWHGLVFISLSTDGDPDVADFDQLAGRLEPYVSHYGVARAKVAHREFYPTEGNWKLAVENFMECYHCAPAHPEYTVVNAYVTDDERDPEGRQATVAKWKEAQTKRGRPRQDFNCDGATEPQPHGVFRQPIRDGYLTLSREGQPVAPLMGQIDEFDGGETALVFGPLSYAYLCSDHATIFRFTPTSARHTEVMVSWLVREDATEGRDYDLESLTWMWDVTTIEDTKIIGDNQKGVNSRRYTPGPYSTSERHTDAFVRWYVARVADHEYA
jgi:phenylpropionate dioxygenase-like ring-hydroxylating dioxygenase large terminal subunit